jgi:predicted Zn-dependent peptidase
LDNKELSNQVALIHQLPKDYKATPSFKKYEFTTQSKNEVLFADYDMVQAEIQWFRNGMTYDPEKVPTVNMFNEYFGGNMSGIVFQEIRESKALAYSTYAAFASAQKKGEPFGMNAYVGCQADKMKEAVGAMQELLTELPKSEKLFSQSQASIKNSISTSRTTKTGILFSYLTAQKRGINYDLNEKNYNAVDKMNFEDINQFFKENIAGVAYTLCVVGGDKKVNWDVLNKFGPVKKLTLEQVFGY